VGDALFTVLVVAARAGGLVVEVLVVEDSALLVVLTVDDSVPEVEVVLALESLAFVVVLAIGSAAPVFSGLALGLPFTFLAADWPDFGFGRFVEVPMSASLLLP
jgi:hypothetical protein